MIRRLLDVALAGSALLLTAPVLALAAAAIRLTSPGPVLYRARRVGQGGRPFTMYKLRTMQVAAEPASRITGVDDPRVSSVGRWLRRSKVDELPQLWNVLRGDMAIVGPRPEDPEIVARHYTPEHLETLLVRPGLTSPGALFQYTQGDGLLSGPDPESAYAERLLPHKLELDLQYQRRASLAADIAVMARTALAIVARLLGTRPAPIPRDPEPPRSAGARPSPGSHPSLTPDA